jgi:hypothetical protein
VGNDVPFRIGAELDSNDGCPLCLHVKCQEPARGTDLQYASTRKWDAPEVVVNPIAQIELASDHRLTWHLHHVVKVTFLDV